MNWKKAIRKLPTLGLVYAGVLFLAVGWLAEWTNHNWYLFFCLVLVVLGVVLHVWRMKSESRY